MTSAKEPWTETDDLPKILPRDRESHKGSFGRVLVIAGSQGMSGAAILAGSAALRAGAGLVTVASPASIQPIVAMGEPSYMTLPLPEDSAGRVTASAARIILSRPWDAIAIGPGLGRSHEVDSLMAETIQSVACPMVIDADGLFSLARSPFLLQGLLGHAILTPHLGEFQRLLGHDPEEPIDDPLSEVRFLQQQTQAVIVLKGHRSIVADRDHYRINTTGNPGMATGGTGDILTGILVGLLGQGWSTCNAARLGVHLHGMAGDIAATEKGEISLIARDLLESISKAFIQYQNGSSQNSF
ncbi:NAD(P)H-hydrate dehydratase [bacterium]|nr:NAD(P)H-hydrate dehydratase [bacterium]